MRSVSRIRPWSSESAVSRSVRWVSRLSTWASACSYSRSASGLTGPSCSRRRPSRSSLRSISARSVVVERARRRAELAAERRGDPPELGGGLGAAVAEVGDPDLGLGDRLSGGLRSCACSSASSREQARSCVGDGVARRSRRASALERRGALAGGVAGVGRGLAELPERGDQRRLALEPLRERVLARLPSMSSTPARHPRGAVGGLAHLRRAPRPARRRRPPRGRVRAPRSAASSDSPIRSSPALTGSSPARAPVASASSSASAPSAARRRSSAADQLGAARRRAPRRGR